MGGSRALTQVSLFLLGALGFFLFSFKPVLVGGEGEISFQFPPPLLQSRAALGEREALKHSGQADFSGSSPPPPTPAPPPHDGGVGMEGGVGAHPTGRDSRWRGVEEQEEVGREGRRKGLRGRLRAAVPSRNPGSRRTPSFQRGSPRRAAPSPQRPRHTGCPAALPAGGGPVSAAGSARLAHTAAAAAGQRSSGRSPPAALNYSWGVYYIRSHKLEPLCNAIRECYARSPPPPPPLRFSLALSPCSA